MKHCLWPDCEEPRTNGKRPIYCLEHQREQQKIDYRNRRPNPSVFLKPDVGEGWRSRAACNGADPGLFMPLEEGPPDPHKYDEGQKICAKCPVKRQCLQWAIDSQSIYGLWGGVGPRERARLRSQRKKDKVA